MDKTAQKRHSVGLREKVDIFGRGAEALSPTFAALMQKLRDTDDKIRDSLLDDDVRLKDLLKSAKKKFNLREYMQAVADLSTFHEKLENVVDILRVLEFDVDTAHHEFIGNDLPEDTLEKLRRTQERIKAKKTKKAAVKVWIQKQAGILDLWGLLNTDREKGLRGWEKRYPTKMRQLKSQTASLINKSESLFSTLLVSLKEMSSARGARNLDRYLKAAKKITDTFNNYNTQYEKYYEENIDNFLSKVLEKEKAAAALKAEKGEPSEEAKKVKTEETGLGEKEVAPTAKETTEEVDPRSYVPPSSYRQPTPGSERPVSEVVEKVPATDVDSKPPTHVPSTQTSAPQAQTSGPPTDKDIDPSEPYRMLEKGLPANPVPAEFAKTLAPNAPGSTMRSRQMPTPIPTTIPEHPKVNSPGGKGSLNSFIYMLESLSNESPEMMALEINKFAKSIQKNNPQTSRKLLAIVEEILDGK